jgi:hypothetical protein
MGMSRNSNAIALSAVRIHHDFIFFLLFANNLSIVNEEQQAINVGVQFGLY